METEQKQSWHTECFRWFCHIASWLAILAILVASIACLSSREDASVSRAWATLFESVEIWFMCRLAIVVIQIRDKVVG